MSDYEFWGLPGEDMLGNPFDSRLDRKLRRQMLGAHICFGGGKGGSSAPAPDPQIGEAALKQAQLGEDWLDFAKEQFAVGNERQVEIDALSKKVTESQLKAQDQSMQWAAEDREISQKWGAENREKASQIYDSALKNADQARADADRYSKTFDRQADQQYQFASEQQQRYKDTFRPIEDRIAKDAMSWDSAERQAEMAAQARADVMANSAAAQQQQSRQLAAMGVDPRSGRFQGASRASNLQTALAAAGAQNAARDSVRQQAQGLRQGAAALGMQVNQTGQQASQLGMQATSAGHQAKLAGDSAAMQWNNLGMAARGIGNSSANLSAGSMGYQGLGIGLNAGSSAMGTTLGANSAWQQNNAIMGQGFGGAMQGYAGQANTLNSLYGNQLNAWSAGQQASAASAAGLMQGIGTISGAAMIASSKDYKEDKRPVEGSALAAVESMPVEQWKYKDGVADGGQHIGPYAEDFQAATGKGDGKTIPVQDAIGVTMKAVQELSAKVDTLAKNKMAGGIA